MYLYYLLKDDPFHFRSGKMLHVLGLAGLVLAMLTGRNAASNYTANDPLSELINNHEIIGYGAIWAFSMLLVWVYFKGKNHSKKELGIFTFVYFSLFYF